MNKYIYSLFLLIPLFCLNLYSNDIPDPPAPPRLVNDFANILEPNHILSIENKLTSFDRQTSTQIVIVTVKDLAGYDRADFTTRLAEKWGVGRKGKDNGIVIMVKPKTALSNGQAFIAVGYGLEGAIPDATANRIIDNEMIPEFKKNDYYSGLNNAVDVLVSLTKGEYTADEYYKKTRIEKVKSPIPFIILMILFFSIFGRARSRRQHSVGRNIPFWIALTMLGSSRGSHGGSFGNFSSGGGSFGGFGGGGFGGGGAGGSW